MTLDSDDLEQVLQQNLEIRRELGAEIGKVDGIRALKQERGMVYRLGWVLYWACLAIAVGCVAYWLILKVRGHIEDFGMEEALTIVALPPLIIYGLGRAFRYVLSGE